MGGPEKEKKKKKTSFWVVQAERQSGRTIVLFLLTLSIIGSNKLSIRDSRVRELATPTLWA